MYKKEHIHFVGIAGIGMSAIAHILLHLGYIVSGSDVKENNITDSLARLGGTIYKGHAPENVLGADVVVVSSAINSNNLEIEASTFAKIPVIPRAEMLAGLMKLKKIGIAVAGTHGKTSTTSMVASILKEGGLDPTLIIGGEVKALGSNAYWGNGDFVVAEADESDGSFLRLSPSIAIVTNIESEHMDYYKNMDSLLESFKEFFKRVPFYGLSIVCGDDPVIQEIIPEINGKIMTYGTGEFNDIRATDIVFEGMSASYTASIYDEVLGKVRLQVPGLHHVKNSLAALAVGIELEIPFGDIARGLERYQGVRRRFEVKGEEGGVIIVDDYAHHPTELKATISAARKCWPDKRMIALFEPHRYTRTRDLMGEFAGAFEGADEIWITEIYPASEMPIVGVSGERLARLIQEKLGSPVHYVMEYSELPEKVLPYLRPGDVVLTLGAGNIGRIGTDILLKLGQKTEKKVLAC